MELCLRRIDIEDVRNYFEFVNLRRSSSRSMRRFKKYLVRSNLEEVERVYRKLVAKYRYPIWLNVKGLVALDRSISARYSGVYYLYIKDGAKVVDFLGVCFYTPTNDLIFSVRLRKVLKWSPYVLPATFGEGLVIDKKGYGC